MQSQRTRAPLRGHAVRRTSDRHPAGELVVADDQLEQDAPSRSSIVQPNVSTNAGLGPYGTTVASSRHDEEDRDRVRDRAGEVPLPLQLDLAALAVR